MPKLTIDGIEIEVEKGVSVLQACEQLGIEIPRFCYHDRLSVPANCRMCLVEVKPGPPKPQPSCALACGEGMEVKTDSPMVHAARKGVMEFLLINHPLDCPICDQGGECDLQDQAMAYGFDHSRFKENKRAVKEKYLGPLIKTYMTRCIHCTRCVRFADEIAGVPEMGATERGEHMEIGTYVETAVSTELSGNMIDICPVGALTSKPYQFNARPWELRKTESIDVMDAVGSNVRVDARGGEVLRVLPRLHEDVNEEWLGDKSRFAYDGLKRQRLDRPYVRGVDGKLKPATWDQAFQAVVEKLGGLPGDKIAAIAGDLVDVEGTVALKDFMAQRGSPHIDCRQDGAKIGGGPRGGYILNSAIAGLETADAVLLIGTDPRKEAPLVNARLRKRYLRGGIDGALKVGVVGAPVDLTFPATHLGDGAEALQAVVDGSSPFAETLKAAKRPAIVLGMGALIGPDGAAVLAAARKIAQATGMIVAGDDETPGWNGFNVLHTAAGRVGALDAGFLPGDGGRDVEGILAGAEDGSIEAVWLFGADEIDTRRLEKAFVIYQGHHGDRGAHAADVILPGAAYTEKNATYVNTEGRVQQARMAVFPPGEAKEDWKILRALSERMGQALPYDNLRDLRRRMVDLNPVFGEVDTVAPGDIDGIGAEGPLSTARFASPVSVYYMTDPISRASRTMAACIEEIVEGRRPAPAVAAE